MNWRLRPKWSIGDVLYPDQLYQLGNYFQGLFSAFQSYTFPFPYGFSLIECDVKECPEPHFEVKQCAGLFKNGMPFCHMEEGEPLCLSLASFLETPPDDASITISLIWNGDFSTVLTPILSRISGAKAEKDLTFCCELPALSLSLSDLASDRSALPIARLCRNNNRMPLLDSNFVPPLLNVFDPPGAPLLDVLKQLMKLISGDPEKNPHDAITIDPSYSDSTTLRSVLLLAARWNLWKRAGCLTPARLYEAIVETAINLDHGMLIDRAECPRVAFDPDDPARSIQEFLRYIKRVFHEKAQRVRCLTLSPDSDLGDKWWSTDEVINLKETGRSFFLAIKCHTCNTTKPKPNFVALSTQLRDWRSRNIQPLFFKENSASEIPQDIKDRSEAGLLWFRLIVSQNIPKDMEPDTLKLLMSDTTLTQVTLWSYLEVTSKIEERR